MKSPKKYTPPKKEKKIEIKKMPVIPITEIKPSNEMSYSHSNQPSTASTETAGKSHEERPEVIKRKKEEAKQKNSLTKKEKYNMLGTGLDAISDSFSDAADAINPATSDQQAAVLGTMPPEDMMTDLSGIQNYGSAFTKKFMEKNPFPKTKKY